MAVLLFTLWQFVFWVCLWAVLTLLAPAQIPYFVAIYIAGPFLSGLWAARSYLTRSRRLRADLMVNVGVAEGLTEGSQIKQN